MRPFSGWVETLAGGALAQIGRRFLRDARSRAAKAKPCRRKRKTQDFPARRWATYRSSWLNQPYATFGSWVCCCRDLKFWVALQVGIQTRAQTNRHLLFLAAF